MGEGREGIHVWGETKGINATDKIRKEGGGGKGTDIFAAERTEREYMYEGWTYIRGGGGAVRFKRRFVMTNMVVG
jgi:hypothetical protein